MKKTIAILWAVMLSLTLLAGCSTTNPLKDLFGQGGTGTAVTQTEPAGEVSPDVATPEPIPAEISEAPSEPQAPIEHPDAAALIPYYSNKYFLNQLTEEELVDFCALYQAVANFEETCDYPYPVTPEQSQRFGEFLVYECPETMQYDREAPYTYYKNSDELVTSRTIVYTMDPDEYEEKLAAVQSALSSIYATLEGLSDYEKELAVYRYIVSNNTYDRAAEDCENPYGLLVNGHAKCDAITQTFRWLMDMCGIQNYTLTGDLKDRSNGHAWNVVRIDGQWVDLDITHDDLDDEESPDQWSYGLVNVNKSMIRDQYILCDAYVPYDLPGADTMDYCYHVRNGTYVYAGASAADMFDTLLYDAWQSGNRNFSFQIEEEFTYRSFLDNAETIINDTAERYNTSYTASWFYIDESRTLSFHIEFT